ncbi:protein Spindly-like [Pseudochaenichthys georgianus]|uniref:protein Spindly-like n=1 Tax=Pseudochaenichthys georgianus TaxID=52239 RepID=UPI0039C1B656
MKRELERAAAEKLEKVNRSLQRHLQGSVEEKEERERELLSMKKQIATLMQRLRADPAQLERLQSMLSVKNGGIQDLRRKSLSESFGAGEEALLN